MALIDVWASLPLENPEGRESAWQRTKSIASHVFATKYCVLCLFLPCLLGVLLVRRVGANRYRFLGKWKRVEYVIGEKLGSGYYWMTTRDGLEIEGQLRRGRKNGKTKIIWPNGDRFVGRYRDGKANGRGLRLFINGSRYKGEYRNGKPHGQGTMVWPEGDRYEGDFLNGNSHGIGQITFQDGETARCEYRDGELVRWLDDEAGQA